MVRKSASQKIPPAGGVRRVSIGAEHSNAGGRKAAAGNVSGPAKPRRSKTAVRVVGIGASGGDLEALRQLFGKLPADGESSFVVVQHHGPGRKSPLDQTLARVTPLPIIRITNNLKVEPGRIYLNPPGKFVSLSADRLRLTTTRSAGRRSTLPVDHFFGSLAHARGEQAIGIVLSGAGCDGARGVKAIKEAGGLTFAQSPASASDASMTDSAIDTRLIDFSLPADEIAARLTVVSQHPYLCGDTAQAVDDELNSVFEQILATLHAKTGHDVSGYKAALIHRRIARRMAVHQIQHAPDYLRVLNQDPREPERLLQDMLIGVTGFFRDVEAYETLRDKVLIPLVLSRQAGGALRIWVVGCACGEEAYSVAIILAEAMERLNTHPPVQIFASDIDADAIQTARQGAYLESIAVDVSLQRLFRYFTLEKAAYKIKKRVRDNIIFCVHSLIKDPPFCKMDLISCRNLLIHLKPEMQRRVLPLLHYALIPGGHLFLGPTEGIAEFGELFSAVSAKHKIFKRRGVLSESRYRRYHLDALKNQGRDGPPERDRTALPPPDAVGHARQIILDEYAPTAVLIDRNFNILHFFGNADPYLKTPTGKASFNILKIARQGLTHDLRQCLILALASGREQRMENLAVMSPQGLIHAAVIVRPITEESIGQMNLIVLFDRRQDLDDADGKPPMTEKGTAMPPEVRGPVDALQYNKEYLLTTVEMLETANAECRATNEELQSANEELETAREALESTNAELVAVNHEHNQKIEALTRSNNDINNLLESTGIACLFLDLNLRVRRFTPAMTSLINLRRSDIGRPIGDITTRLVGVDIQARAGQVIEDLERRQLEVRDKTGRCYEMRLLPYRMTDNIIDGVTIAFIDIPEFEKPVAAKTARQGLEEGLP
jgi:two-component system CheB/CheR fusion protein